MNPTKEPLSAEQRLAGAIREACVQAALEGYERAGLSGLCHEGAWECAVDAIRSLDLEALLRTLPRPEQDPEKGTES